MLSKNELESLIKKVKEGNHKAFAELAEIYRPLIESKCRKYSCFEEDDSRQICALALYNAACAYDFGVNKVTFGVFASFFMRNALEDERKKIQPASDILNEYDEEIESIQIGTTPEDELIAREAYGELTKKIRESFSQYEMQIFGLYLSGKSYAEMAHDVGKTEKSVGTAVARAKKKLREIIVR